MVIKLRDCNKCPKKDYCIPNELKAAKLTKLAVDAGMNKAIAAIAGVAMLQALNKKAKEDLQRERAKSVN